MKPKFFLLLTAVLLVFAGNSQAGWGWGGGGWCGPRVGWGGGYYGRGWGGGWWGPSFGVSLVAPIPIYRPVYVAQPSYVVQPAYYTQRVVRTVSPSSTLVRVQSQLANLGYYTGYVDGAYGPRTCEAISRYQADYGLRVNGRVDRATIKSLGV